MGFTKQWQPQQEHHIAVVGSLPKLFCNVRQVSKFQTKCLASNAKSTPRQTVLCRSWKHNVDPNQKMGLVRNAGQKTIQWIKTVFFSLLSFLFMSSAMCEMWITTQKNVGCYLLWVYHKVPVSALSFCSIEDVEVCDARPLKHLSTW